MNQKNVLEIKNCMTKRLRCLGVCTAGVDCLREKGFKAENGKIMLECCRKFGIMCELSFGIANWVAACVCVTTQRSASTCRTL